MGRIFFPLILAALSSGVAVYGQQVPANPQQERAIAEIQRLGGRYESDAEDPNKPLASVDLGYTQVSDADLKCLEGLKQLRSLSLESTRVTDAGLEHLKGLTQLQSLDLAETQVTDAGLHGLGGLNQLRELYLSWTKITDAGLEDLKGLDQLRILFLCHTKVTDAGLDRIKGLAQLQTLNLADTPLDDAGLNRIKGMRQLRTLQVGGTRVTNEGVKTLQESLPKCAIDPDAPEFDWIPSARPDSVGEAAHRYPNVPKSRLLCSAGGGSADDTRPAPLVRDTPAQRAARMAWWRQARFGMFIHWGPVSLTGKEISWSRANSNPRCPNHGPTPVDVYDNLYKRFDPEKFDAKQWVATAQAAGMKYMVLTAKHCDGFLLWDSKVDSYNIMHSPLHRDVCAELAQAAHAAGMRIGWYFSPMDWRDPDCRTARNAQFVKRMQAELTELLSHYGKIDLLWFDFDGRSVPWDQENTYAIVKRLQPDIVIDNRLDCAAPKLAAKPESIGPWADYYTPEQRTGGFDTRHPWESCVTVSAHNHWAWGGSNDGVKTLSECMNMLIRIASGDGNTLLDVGPMPTGEIAPEQANRIKEMGDWLAKYGPSIYGTRGGPYTPGINVTSTCNGNTVYLHILSWPKTGDLRLPALPARIDSATLLTGGKVDIQNDGPDMVVKIAPEFRQTLDTLVQLQLDKPAGQITPIQLPPPDPSLRKKTAKK